MDRSDDEDRGPDATKMRRQGDPDNSMAWDPGKKPPVPRLPLDKIHI